MLGALLTFFYGFHIFKAFSRVTGEMVRFDGKDFGDGERVSSRQKFPSAKAPLHQVEGTPPLGSVCTT